MTTEHKKTSVLWILAMLVVIVLGVYLRIHSFEKMEGIGFDENIYRRYVEQIAKHGWLHYPEVVEMYITEQKLAPIAFLPPTRVSFLLAATSWQGITGMSSIESVRSISTAASIILLLGVAAFSKRLGGNRLSIVTTTLMAFAPLPLYMAHRALIDGFFATVTFFVMWALWECLQKAKNTGWLIFYGMCLAVLVLTKENAAFVYLAILAILVFHRWLKFGEVTKQLVFVTFLGPLLGAGLLALAAGGAETLFTAYLLNVRMSYNLPYAIATGDGPWFRYLSDLILTSPIIILLAIGGIFRLEFKDKSAWYFTIFILVSYLIMGNLRYGMNLRYALIWDFPLCYLAGLSLIAIANSCSSPVRQKTILTTLLITIVYFQLDNYDNIFIKNEVYDPVPKSLMQALNMIK